MEQPLSATAHDDRHRVLELLAAHPNGYTANVSWTMCRQALLMATST
ncbi:MAG: hypothetical protein WBZ35_11760 [Pseudolabrys sp.]|jgi:hypothetical protein